MSLLRFQILWVFFWDFDRICIHLWWFEIFIIECWGQALPMQQSSLLPETGRKGGRLALMIIILIIVDILVCRKLDIGSCIGSMPEKPKIFSTSRSELQLRWIFSLLLFFEQAPQSKCVVFIGLEFSLGYGIRLLFPARVGWRPQVTGSISRGCLILLVLWVRGIRAILPHFCNGL